MDIEKIKTECNELLPEITGKINSVSSSNDLESLRIEYLGKKSLITNKMAEIRNIPNELKKDYGQIINELKNSIANALESRKEEIEVIELEKKLESDKIDITLPVREEAKGSIHPISQTLDAVIAIFTHLGFEVKSGPEIELADNNFTKLNILENHPARQMHDTFYIESEKEEEYLLRTHTSPVQIRTMLNSKPPFKIISPGKTFRCDSDQTHTPMFHQVEALYIDKNINMGHLKYTLQQFLRMFFEVDDVPLRFRPSFFPFTEPSAEVDIGYSKIGNQIKIGGTENYLEILGSGMVHPNVLRNVGIDPNEYQGFAFGCGLERLAMLKTGAPDLRAFFNGDIRWMKHYNFSAFDIPSMIGGISE